MIDDTVDAAEIPQNHLECIKKTSLIIMVDFNIFQLSTCLNRFSETGFLKHQQYLIMASHPLDTDSWRASRPKTSACTSRSAGARSDMVSLGLVVWEDVENDETKNFMVFFSFISSIHYALLALLHGLSLCNHTVFSHVSKTSMKFKPLETGNFEQLRRSQDLQLLQLLTEFLPSCCRLPP